MTPRTPTLRRSRSGASTTVGLTLWIALGAGALALAPGTAQAQSAQEILGRALEANSRRLAGIDNLTVRQDAMGVSTTTYLEKEMVEGYPVLYPRHVGAMGVEMDDEGWEFWADPRSLYGEAADKWILEGAGSVDGRATWQLSIAGSDIPVLDDDSDDDEIFEAERLLMDLDQERLVPLRIEVQGIQMEEDRERPMTMVLYFSDYREVEGYLHPFLTVVEMGLGQEGLSPEEIAEARQAMEEFERQMVQVPEAQRQMMEEMLGDQIRMFEQVLAGEDVQWEIRVTELVANQGPPDGA